VIWTGNVEQNVWGPGCVMWTGKVKHYVWKDLMMGDVDRKYGTERWERLLGDVEQKVWGCCWVKWTGNFEQCWKRLLGDVDRKFGTMF